MVELTDLAPTFMEAVGLPVAKGMQGHSIWSALTEETDLYTLRDDVYTEYYNANPGHRERWLTMLRTPTHKIIVCHGTSEGELYNMEADPTELNNLWEDASKQDLKLKLLLRLSARMSFTADPLPERCGIF
jgi:arylsulfatase A-like enzyme